MLTTEGGRGTVQEIHSLAGVQLRFESELCTGISIVKNGRSSLMKSERKEHMVTYWNCTSSIKFRGIRGFHMSLKTDLKQNKKQIASPELSCRQCTN